MNNGGFGTGHTSDSVLIDTWWNVNFHRFQQWLNRNIVLIDTWWNVNYVGVVNVDINKLVLIDTWWNVNVRKRR